MVQAAKDLVEKEEKQVSLEDTIFQELKKIEEEGNFTKNEPITRESAKSIVAEIVMNLNNWVKVARGRNTAVTFTPEALGAAMNQYLRCPKAFRQFREDSCLVQPSPSYCKQLKSTQHVTDGICPAMSVIQPTIRADPNGEVGHLACDEIKLNKGVVMNSKTQE